MRKVALITVLPALGAAVYLSINGSYREGLGLIALVLLGLVGAEIYAILAGSSETETQPGHNPQARQLQVGPDSSPVAVVESEDAAESPISGRSGTGSPAGRWSASQGLTLLTSHISWWIAGARRRAKATLSHAQAMALQNDELNIGWSARNQRIAEFLLVMGLALVALVLCLDAIYGERPGTYHDEITVLGVVKRILSEGWIGFFVFDNSGMGALTHYFAAPFVFLGGPTLEMLRLSQGVFYVAMVPITYLLVKSLFGIRVGALSTAMVAFCSWFVFQSAIGWDVAITLPLFLAGVYLLLSSLRTERVLLAIAGGLVFALGLYTGKIYLVYFVAALGAIVGSIIVSQRLRRRTELRYFVGTALVVGGRVLLFYAQDYNLLGTLAGHYGADTSISISSLLDRVRHLGEIILLVHEPMHQGADGLGGVAIIGFFPALLFWIGLATALLLIYKPRHQLLILGWLISMLPELVAPSDPSRRYLLGIFFILVFVAIGANTTLDQGIRLLKNNAAAPNWMRGRKVMTGIGIAALVTFAGFFAMENRHTYGKLWTEPASARWHFDYDLVKAHSYLQSLYNELGDHYEVRFYRQRSSWNGTHSEYYNPRLRGSDGSEEHGGDGTIGSGGPITEDTVFVLLDKYVDLVHELKATFPMGTLREERDEDGNIVYAAYVIRSSPS